MKIATLLRIKNNDTIDNVVAKFLEVLEINNIFVKLVSSEPTERIYKIGGKLSYDESEVGSIYECLIGKRPVPLHIGDKIPAGLVCKNLDNGKEVFINKKDVPRRVKSRIESMDQWRLKNGD